MRSAAICFLLMGLTVAAVLACGPFFPVTVFTYRKHPDFSRNEFLSGKLGVFQPTYARSYLVIAYRYLQGRPLDAVEQQQVRDYWKDRETGQWDKTATYWTERWAAARGKAPGAKALEADALSQGKYRFDSGTNSFFENCAEDAYRNAAETLAARGARFGFASAAVREWRDAQDQVFENCSGKTASIPEPLAETASALTRADRAYQIAAAHFYSGDYETAEEEFRAIGEDGQSPWREIAPYLVVRTLSREAEEAPEKRTAAIEAAQAILSDPKRSALHGMTRVVLHRNVLKSHDEGYFHALAQDLARSRTERSVREELWDYTTLFDQYLGENLADFQEPKWTDAARAAFAKDDLSDWISTYQEPQDAKAAAHALRRWRERRTLPWLIAAMRQAKEQSPGVAELLEAAGRVEAASPGYEAAQFYRTQLLLDRGEKDVARRDLDAILQRPLPASTVNLFRHLRMRAAPELADFLKFAARRPVMLATTDNVGETPELGEERTYWKPGQYGRMVREPRLDRDSVKVLNERVPLRLWREAADLQALPAEAGRDFVLAGFTRSVLLNEAESERFFAGKLRSGGGGADAQGYLAVYEKAESEEEKRFAAVFYLLHHPEARPYLASGLGRNEKPGVIDDYRDNWWCPTDMLTDLDARSNWTGFTIRPRQDVDAPEWRVVFLSGADREEAKREMERLAATHSGADFLLAETMRFARAHVQDPRVPEALHFALRSQRYGCVTEQTAKAAEAAWRYLWKTYPKSPWAKKSNYSFEPANLPTRKDVEGR